MPQNKLTRDEFLAKVKAGTNSTRPEAKATDWSELYALGKVVFKDLPFTASEFYIQVVKGVVGMQRARDKLKQLVAQGELAVVYTATHQYMWTEQL